MHLPDVRHPILRPRARFLEQAPDGVHRRAQPVHHLAEHVGRNAVAEPRLDGVHDLRDEGLELGGLAADVGAQLVDEMRLDGRGVVGRPLGAGWEGVAPGRGVAEHLGGIPLAGRGDAGGNLLVQQVAEAGPVRQGNAVENVGELVPGHLGNVPGRVVGQEYRVGMRGIDRAIERQSGIALVEHRANTGGGIMVADGDGGVGRDGGCTGRPGRDRRVWVPDVHGMHRIGAGGVGLAKLVAAVSRRFDAAAELGRCGTFPNRGARGGRGWLGRLRRRTGRRGLRCLCGCVDGAVDVGRGQDALVRRDRRRAGLGAAGGRSATGFGRCATQIDALDVAHQPPGDGPAAACRQVARAPHGHAYAGQHSANGALQQDVPRVSDVLQDFLVGFVGRLGDRVVGDRLQLAEGNHGAGGLRQLPHAR